MWCDDFDMDLAKHFPLAHILRETRKVKLLTNGGLSGGKLNHPSVWNGYESMMAFFSLAAPEATPDHLPPCLSSRAKPKFYITDAPVVLCTFEEALRDCWPHFYRLHIDGLAVWDSFQFRSDFMRLMYDLRGIHRETAAALNGIRRKIENSLYLAVGDLLGLLTFYPTLQEAYGIAPSPPMHRAGSEAR